MSTDVDDPRHAAIRIEALIAELGATGDARIKAAAEDLVRQLMRLYGAGLGRMLHIAYRDNVEAASVWLQRLADDPLVAGLLALHDLHPHAIEHRVARAIDRVRPIVEAAGGHLTLVDVGSAAIRVRLTPATGLSAPAVNLRPLVERALAEAAPEIARIEFEGEAAAAPLQLIQITR